eukprot:366301-Chlamydomonas_euryale.AAC.52
MQTRPAPPCTTKHGVHHPNGRKSIGRGAARVHAEAHAALVKAAPTHGAANEERQAQLKHWCGELAGRAQALAW